jgi:hypothetical protein
MLIALGGPPQIRRGTIAIVADEDPETGLTESLCLIGQVIRVVSEVDATGGVSHEQPAIGRHHDVGHRVLLGVRVICR